ncbi:hypothetical protein HK098_002164 [Nowakowskiella sp. JEL0407]|nr:hypothetical protein HK098_002164 [Nowakowskiella sp. JEL0407]
MKLLPVFVILLLLIEVSLAIPKGGGGGGGGRGGGSSSGGSSGGSSGSKSGSSGSSGSGSGSYTSKSGKNVFRSGLTGRTGRYYPYLLVGVPLVWGGYVAGRYYYWYTPSCTSDNDVIGFSNEVYRCSEIYKCRNGNDTVIYSVLNESETCSNLATQTAYEAEEDSGLSTGAIVGISIAGVVVVGIIICIVCMCIRRRKSKSGKDGAVYSAVDTGATYDTGDPPPPLASHYESFKNASSDEFQRALAYQKQFPPPEYPSIPVTLKDSISARGLDAFRFSTLDPNWVFIHPNDVVEFMAPIPDADASVLSEFPLTRADIPVCDLIQPLSDKLDVRRAVYFEVTILEMSYSPLSVISVGLATNPYPPFRSVGWNNYSIGYHSDDGRVFENDGYGGRVYASPYSVNHTIGCGYEELSGRVFFTLNGSFVGEAAMKPARHPYHAALASDGRAKIKFNFGKEPFLYKFQ